MPRQNHQISNAGEGPNIMEQMEILNAETYDDEAAVSIARSLTELARQRPGPPAHMFGMTGGFEVISERRADVPRVAAQRAEVKETKTRKARKARGANTGEDEDKGGRRRKKQKLSEDEDVDEDDASKKSRGRPRLDTKDETAADVGVYISLCRYFVLGYRHFIYSEDIMAHGLEMHPSKGYYIWAQAAVFYFGLRE